MNRQPWERDMAERVYHSVVSGAHRRQIAAAATRQTRRYLTAGTLGLVGLAGAWLWAVNGQPDQPAPPADTPVISQPSAPTTTMDDCLDADATVTTSTACDPDGIADDDSGHTDESAPADGDSSGTVASDDCADQAAGELAEPDACGNDLEADVDLSPPG